MNDGWEPKLEMERDGFLYKISIEVFMLASFEVPERKQNTQEEWRGMERNAENQSKMHVFVPYAILASGFSVKNLHL